jgi:predicted nucleotidyltransferase
MGVLVHWIFQGMLYMDRTELIFKLFLDFSLTILFSIVLSAWFSWQMALITAFVLAHSVNFIFNSQFWVVMKFYGLVSLSFEEYEIYSKGIAERICKASCFSYAGIFGSRVREEWKSYSDLDLRLVRTPGFWNGLRGCFFLVQERTRALIRRFPLDIYILDSNVTLKRLRQDESPIILLDRRVDAE